MIETDQAVIFVGGLGTRLGKITKKIPKPLIKVCKKPFIEHLILFFQNKAQRNNFTFRSYKKNYLKKNIIIKIFLILQR